MQATAAKEIEVSLAICAEEYLRLYQGNAQVVRAMTRDGKRVLFPARILRPFVQREGVYGVFVILYDEQSRFVDIVKKSY